MEKEGFKVGLPLSPASVGGLLKLIGLALLTCNQVEGIEELAKAWIKLFPDELLLRHQGEPKPSFFHSIKRSDFFFFFFEITCFELAC